MSTQKAKEVAELASPELAFLMADSSLALGTQLQLLKQGFKTVRLVSALEDTTAGARNAFQDLFAFDFSANPTDRVTLSMLVDLWTSCKAHATRENELRSQASVAGHPIAVSATERTAMR